MENQEYIPCHRSHVIVSFHSFYAFLKNNLVYTMLNPLRKKIVRIYTMPNSLLRETNSLRSIYHALRLTTLGIHNMIDYWHIVILIEHN